MCLLQIKYVDFYDENESETEFYTTVFLAYRAPIHFKHISQQRHFLKSELVSYFETEKKSGTTNGNKDKEKQG